MGLRLNYKLLCSLCSQQLGKLKVSGTGTFFLVGDISSPEGVPDHVTRVVHMCCGYPRYLDETGYKKADPQTYFDLAEAMDAAPIDQISLEDAHRHNDLSLLEKYSRTTIILGVVTS